MDDLLSYPISDIPLEGIAVDRVLPSHWLDHVLRDAEAGAGRDDDAPCDGHLKGRLSTSGDDVVVRARVKATVEVPCTRCLEPAQLPVEADMSLLLVPRPRPRGSRPGRRGREPRDSEVEFSSEDAQRDEYDGENVVLDSFVREAILLELPSYPLCREECPGLMAQLGPQPEAPAIDPRMAPLSAFVERDPNAPATVADLIAAAAARSGHAGKKPILRASGSQRNRSKKKKK